MARESPLGCWPGRPGSPQQAAALGAGQAEGGEKGAETREAKNTENTSGRAWGRGPARSFQKNKRGPGRDGTGKAGVWEPPAGAPARVGTHPLVPGARLPGCMCLGGLARRCQVAHVVLACGPPRNGAEGHRPAGRGIYTPSACGLRRCTNRGGTCSPDSRPVWPAGTGWSQLPLWGVGMQEGVFVCL